MHTTTTGSSPDHGFDTERRTVTFTRSGEGAGHATRANLLPLCGANVNRPRATPQVVSNDWAKVTCKRCLAIVAIDQGRRPGALTNASTVHQLRDALASSTNRKLLELYRQLITLISENPRHEAIETFKLTRSLLIEELTERNPLLDQALDASTADQSRSTETVDEIVLRHTAAMDPEGHHA